MASHATRPTPHKAITTMAVMMRGSKLGLSIRGLTGRKAPGAEATFLLAGAGSKIVAMVATVEAALASAAALC